MSFILKNKIREYSHKMPLLDDIYSGASRVKAQHFAYLSDEEFIKMRYKENTGEDLNLEKPITFNEKLCWLMVNNRDPLITKCSDKYLVREYVMECGLECILNDLYGVYDNPEDIDYDNLPKQFFLKCTHGSGFNIRCNDKAKFPRKKAAIKLQKMLKSNYYLQTREWNYRDIKPRIVCERVLENMEAGGLVDYNFFCFHGQPKILMYNLGLSDREGSHAAGKRLVFDMNFDLLDIITSKERFDSRLAHRPINFDKMIQYAAKLSKPFPHVRVDFFNIEGRIYFGEMTFYSGGGNVKLKPDEWQLRLGRWIDLSKNIVKR